MARRGILCSSTNYGGHLRSLCAVNMEASFDVKAFIQKAFTMKAFTLKDFTAKGFDLKAFTLKAFALQGIHPSVPFTQVKACQVYIPIIPDPHNPVGIWTTCHKAGFRDVRRYARNLIKAPSTATARK